MSSKPDKVSGVVHAPLRAPTLAAPLVAHTGGHRPFKPGEPCKLAQLERELEKTKLALAALEVTMKTGVDPPANAQLNALSAGGIQGTVPNNGDKKAITRYFYHNTWALTLEVPDADRSTLRGWEFNEYSDIESAVTSVLRCLDGMLYYIPDGLRSSTNLKSCAKDATYQYEGLLRPGVMQSRTQDSLDDQRLDQLHQRLFDAGSRFTSIYLKNAELEQFILVLHVPKDGGQECFVSLLVVAREDETNGRPVPMADPRWHTTTRPSLGTS
tara:strand:+ start:230 stop:1039 length:810 start_codon:yes stop_codon:yes gene_type:complete